MVAAPWDRNLARDQEARQRHGQNRGRLVSVHVSLDSSGWGEYAFPDLCDFGTTFIEEPSVGYGYRLIEDSPVGTIGSDLVKGWYPMSHGFVHEWHTKRGDPDTGEGGAPLYNGAWCAVVINSGNYETLQERPVVHLRHYFTFEGVALKVVPFDIGAGE